MFVDDDNNNNNNNYQWFTLLFYITAWTTSNSPNSFITTVYIKLQTLVLGNSATLLKIFTVNAFLLSLEEFSYFPCLIATQYSLLHEMLIKTLGETSCLSAKYRSFKTIIILKILVYSDY